MENDKIRIAEIIWNDTVNGKGINISVWSQGCPHKCKGCHNPGTWSIDGGREIEKDTLIKSVLDHLNDNDVNRNLSILGGEPLAKYNRQWVKDLILAVKSKYPEKKIFLWTGYTYEDLLDEEDHCIFTILEYIDYLIEGPYIEALRDIRLSLRGSKNQRIMIHHNNDDVPRFVLKEIDLD